MVVAKSRRYLALAALSSLLFTSLALAQLPQTRLYSLNPVGGQVGQEFEVTITSGDDLEEVTSLVFSNPKITAKQKTTEQNGQQIPVNNVFIVNVPADVEPGVYEARCGGLFGFSNPRRFAIDQNPVVADTADNNSAEKATPLELGSVVNGRLESGNDLDWFRVSAKQGQRLVLDVWAERLDSRMNPVISIYDSTGRRRFDWSRNSIGYDPVLLFDVPADGDYCVLLHDVTYRNGNDYFYRLHAHTNPHLEFAWPPSGQAGTNSDFTLYGYNLPGGTKTGEFLHGAELESLKVKIDVPAATDLLDVENRVRPYAAATDAFSYRLKSDSATSNPVRIGITPLNVVPEIEPNDDVPQAQLVTAPVEIGGKFGELEDTDTFRFAAKAGEVYFIEAIAERLGTNTDPFLVVNQITKAADGTETVKRLTAQDDVATNLLANVFETKTDDPVFRLQVPADGLYEVVLRDRYWESRGHALLRYSLAIRRETPDFRVIAVPSAPTAGQTWPTGLRRGDQFPISLLAFRQDGFNGPIEVSAVNLPEGLSCPPVVIGPGESTSTLMVTSSLTAPVGLHEIELNSIATLEDQQLVQTVAAEQLAVANAAKPIADLQQKLNMAVTNVAAPQAAYDAAAKASQDAPDDANLKTQLEAAKKALEAVIAQKDAAQKALTDAQAAMKTAESKLASTQLALQKSTQQITHPVRSGTVIWSSAANVPAISRVSDAFTLSVINEEAPFQVTSDIHRLKVHQGRQILVPVKLEKRDGFDDKVTLTTQGIPKNANIDFPNAEIAKGEAEKMLAMFVKENAPPGFYTIWMKTQGQVGYKRNPGKADRLQKENEQAKAKADEAQKASQAATQKKNETTAAFTQAQQTLQQSQTNVKTAEAAVTTAQQQLDQATKELAAANKQVVDTQAKVALLEKQFAEVDKAFKTKQAEFKVAEQTVVTAQTAADEARKAATALETQIAELNKQIAEQPDNAELKTQLESATKALQEQQSLVTATAKAVVENTQKRDGLKTAQDELAVKTATAQQELANSQQQLATFTAAAGEVQKKMKSAEQALATKKTELTTAQAAVTKATAELKVATDAKTAAEAAEKSAVALAASTEAVRKAAEKAATDAANAAKPKNINFTPPTTPIVVEVLPAPAKLAATVPNGGKVKKGETIEVAVKITRQNNFSGPVTIALATPPGVTGLTAEAVQIPADQTDGKLIIAAKADAPDGKIANVVIRAAMEFGGSAEVDAPITVETTN